VDVSSGEEPPRQKDSALETPEDVEVPIGALITLCDPDPTALEGTSMQIDALVTPQDPQEPVVAASIIGSSLERPAVTSATSNLPSKEMCPPEPTAASSAAALPSDGVNPQELITSSSAATASFHGQVHFISQVVFVSFCTALLTCLLSEPEPLRIACV
jgi:hypothetical protein